MKKKYDDAMLDVETLGTNPDSVVLSIGIVLFNLTDEDNYETLDDDTRCFYITLDPQDQIDMGRSLTFKTIKWWQDQDIQARLVFNDCEKHVDHQTDNQSVLSNMVFKLGDCRNICLWGNGSGFDNPIFNSLLGTYSIANPFRFWNDNDLRTLKRLAGGYKPNIVRGTYHNALDDAKFQVLAAQDYLRNIQ